MRSEKKRKEYVLSQHGQIYRGTYRRIKGTPWNYGQVPKTNILGSVMVVKQSLFCLFVMHLQFDTDILDICLMILDSNPKFISDADQDCSARKNPIYVTRVLSAMVGPLVLWLCRLPRSSRKPSFLNSSLHRSSFLSLGAFSLLQATSE